LLLKETLLANIQYIYEPVIFQFTKTWMWRWEQWFWPQVSW